MSYFKSISKRFQINVKSMLLLMSASENTTSVFKKNVKHKMLHQLAPAGHVKKKYNISLNT